MVEIVVLGTISDNYYQFLENLSIIDKIKNRLNQFSETFSGGNI